MKRIVLGAALAMLCASPALAQSSCLRVNQIYSFNAPDNRTVIVENIQHNKFKVTLLSTCIGLTFKQGLGFKSIGGTGLSCLGRGDYVLNRQQGIGGQRCFIKSVVPYTKAMQDADKAAKAAKKSSGN